MKAQRKLRGDLIIEIEAETQVDLFEGLASAAEVFGAKACGKCGNTNLEFTTRVVDDNKFYELMCLSCYARLAMGAHKKGKTLFPKRRDNETGDVTGEPNGFLPDNGWLKWDKENKKLY